jgi:hypothetical protein
VRITALALTVLILTVAPSVPAQKQMAQSPRVQSAKTVYFENQTGSDAVGSNALAQLKKWGKFQIVADPKKADLVLLLSADPYRDGNLIFASGQTGQVDSDGHTTRDTTPNFNKQSPTRDAYLTVIDPTNLDTIWSPSHVWGGVLTGVNSVGVRLVKELQKQSAK